ncbi:UNVERIFIED_CONTAM: FecR family protein, partial [Prevotella sp. 15_C9]
STGETLHCPGGITIIAERGARYTLSDPDHTGRVGSVELTDRALLLDVPGARTGRSFKVTTPQAIAAVRGTRWAVDAADDKTSVFVVN